jgi:uncharacterized protein YigE (DUF2233 family)
MRTDEKPTPYTPRTPWFAGRPVAVTVTLLLCFTGVIWMARGATPTASVGWESLSPGLDVAVWEPGDSCGPDVPSAVVLRVDPERFRFAIYHYRQEGLSSPLTIQQWQERTRASVLFNAGLFREDYSYIGLLLKDGQSLGGKRHPQWHGLFAAEPVLPGLKKARIVDLMREEFPEENPIYREAAQSLMLLDRAGQPRVRRSGRRAHQMVVGEDGRGQILLIKPADVVALWDLAACLRERLPELIHAMAMDGGSSSELLVSTGLLKQASNRRDVGPWASLVDGSGRAHIPLPSVIGVLSR